MSLLNDLAEDAMRQAKGAADEFDLKQNCHLPSTSSAPDKFL